MTVHQRQDWTAGDDWQINATLLDEVGNPFDLDQPHEIKWALVNQAGVKVLDEAAADIVVTDPAAGKCTIYLPAAVTAPLPAGRYDDALRLVFGGTVSTLSYGAVFVAANPWAAAA